MFSRRTEWDFEKTPLSRLAHEKRSRGESLIDLTLSNPTSCGIEFEFPPQLASPPSLSYEPHPKGLLSARSAISRYYLDQAIAVDPESIILTAGTSEAYSFLFRLLCNPGDEVLLPRPGYPLLRYLCRLNDVSPGYYRLQYDGEWHIDIQSVADKISPRTKAMVLLHPHNPTGSYVKKSEMIALQKLVSADAFPFLVDEVFASFPLVNDGGTSAFLFSPDHLTFVLNGLSKLAVLPSMKLAWIAASGAETPRSAALERLEVIADTYLSVATPVQHMLPQILSHARRSTTPLLERIGENYRHLKSAVAGTAVSAFHTEAGWNVIIRLPATRSDEDWCLSLLESSNILVYPGSLFDLDFHACMVASLLPPPKDFHDGVSGILALVSRGSPHP